MTKKLQQKVLIGLSDIARTHNFKVVFHDKATAYVEIETETIYVGINRPRSYNLKKHIDSIVSAFFHEMAHILAAREGRFPLYHSSFEAETETHILAIKRTALRAEIYVDEKGRALQRCYFPDIRFIKTYRCESDRKWLREYYSVL